MINFTSKKSTYYYLKLKHLKDPIFMGLTRSFIQKSTSRTTPNPLDQWPRSWCTSPNLILLMLCIPNLEIMKGVIITSMVGLILDLVLRAHLDLQDGS